MHGGPHLADPSLQRQLYIINMYSILAMASLILFGSLHVSAGQPTVGYLELAGAGTLLLNIVGLHFTRNVSLARTVFLMTILALLVVMLATGGTAGTGIFWFFMFPVSAFFLTGKKQGVLWMGALALVTIILARAAERGTIDLWYGTTTIRQLLVSLLVVSIGIYVYQASREKTARIVDETKTEFLTLASHQLRTPLSAIKWSSELLLNGDMGKLNPEQKKYVKQIYVSNERSASMVDAMLMVSRLELGNISVQLTSVDLPALCHEVFEHQKQEADNKKMHFKEAYDTNLPLIPCDLELMQIILRNILSNAIKYTPKDGSVSLKVTRITRQLSVQSKGTVQIAIQDTGYSIPKSEQKDIFAKMFRASNIKSKDTDGTGLGLYITKSILDQVGGEIHFDSAEGTGTTFFVLLPIEGMRSNTPQYNTEKVHV